MIWDVVIGERTLRVDLTRGAKPGEWLAKMGERQLRLSAAPAGADMLSLVIFGDAEDKNGGASYEVRRSPGISGNGSGGSTEIVISGRRYPVELRDPRALRSRQARGAGAEGPKKILSPMPGKVIRILAEEGSDVSAAQPVLVIEAMKMQNEIKSPKAGKLQKLLVPIGGAVNAGDVLAIVE
jgi:biotin carboxyl carrier protein